MDTHTFKTIYHTTHFSFENFQKTITTLTKYVNNAFGGGNRGVKLKKFYDDSFQCYRSR